MAPRDRRGARAISVHLSITNDRILGFTEREQMKTRSPGQIIGCLVTVIAVNFTAQILPASQPAADFFVSPQGKDEWSERLADPKANDGCG